MEFVLDHESEMCRSKVKKWLVNHDARPVATSAGEFEEVLIWLYKPIGYKLLRRDFSVE
jgi:hypothetical protein